jgi:hypothetical protein
VLAAEHGNGQVPFPALGRWRGVERVRDWALDKSPPASKRSRSGGNSFAGDAVSPIAETRPPEPPKGRDGMESAGQGFEDRTGRSQGGLPALAVCRDQPCSAQTRGAAPGLAWPSRACLALPASPKRDALAVFEANRACAGGG